MGRYCLISFRSDFLTVQALGAQPCSCASVHPRNSCWRRCMGWDFVIISFRPSCSGHILLTPVYIMYCTGPDFGQAGSSEPYLRVGKLIFELGNSYFGLGNSFSSWETYTSSWETHTSSWETYTSSWETHTSGWETRFRVGKLILRVGKLIFELGNLYFGLGNSFSSWETYTSSREPYTSIELFFRFIPKKQALTI